MNRIYLHIAILFTAISPSLYSQEIAGTKDIKALASNKFDTAYKVIGIKDGDTFVVLKDLTPLTIRFTHIDCPEKAQPYGNKAKQFLSTLIFGKYITIAPNFSYDRNKRLLAEVYLNDSICVNKEMIKNGYAWHFLKYSNNQEYSNLEKEARAQKLGLWNLPQPIAPWDWRKGIRSIQ